ncbi:MAG: hypothetical protein H6858_05465 [Rhodospirillales bacterium]|nr:hypothetical protein [Alphaproteobacteria bacterium]MCB1840554.1 hypothetical protein [Alphaproteobacteria bacterium]MCB9977023.1 hypothetical protein [Rhodospirillales bacterium]
MAGPETEFDVVGFVDEARAAQAQRDKLLRGEARTPEDARLAIEQAVDSSLQGLSGGFNRASMQEALTNLMIRFQLMCDRNKMEIPKDSYPAIGRILLAELRENMQAFGSQADPAKMVPLTLYQGSSFTNISQDPEFESLRDQSGLINLAAAKYPSNPRGFLREVMETTSTLQADERYAVLREEAPSIFRYAAINHRKDPHSFLDKIMSGEVRMPQWENVSAAPAVAEVAVTDDYEAG